MKMRERQKPLSGKTLSTIIVTGDEGAVVTKFDNKIQHGKIVSLKGPLKMS
jgi:hypothetical protein